MPPASLLLRWYNKYGRNLPWRHTRDAYRILVSEIMLQQTQVSRVLFYYERWLKQFPNWQALSRATNSDVIRAWSGLGYNRRALMLRNAAQIIVEQGEPKSEEEWRTIKGVGPYTAAALASFSLHQKAFPIDTNIRRVGARLWLSIPFPDTSHDEKIRKAGLAFIEKTKRFHDIPQALFDLATVVCTKNPICAVCPMKNACKAAPKFLSGNVSIPKQSIKKALESRHRDKPYPDRIYRGRILKIVQEKKTTSIQILGKNIDSSFDKEQDQAWLLRMLDRMEKDRLIKRQKDEIQIFE